ncbi:hypothetical protein JB92DRAFT_2851494 [Gautieria morchelliformis]|nr:hypothetical protein JB92DRAFT_2851494 [Gautieria morchelliformis]
MNFYMSLRSAALVITVIIYSIACVMAIRPPELLFLQSVFHPHPTVHVPVVILACSYCRLLSSRYNVAVYEKSMSTQGNPYAMMI